MEFIIGKNSYLLSKINEIYLLNALGPFVSQAFKQNQSLTSSFIYNFFLCLFGYKTEVRYRDLS